jgi:hypothetical protein
MQTLYLGDYYMEGFQKGIRSWSVFDDLVGIDEWMIVLKCFSVAFFQAAISDGFALPFISINTAS